LVFNHFLSSWITTVFLDRFQQTRAEQKTSAAPVTILLWMWSFATGQKRRAGFAVSWFLGVFGIVLE
jgi:hypothetical protein